MDLNFDSLFNHVYDVKDCELITYERGRIVLRTIVNESCCNPYGMAHGGFLYTLCDNAAGLLGYSLGSYVVTMQSSINYISSVRNGEILTIEAKAIHDGRSSKVCELVVCNEKGTLICKATFTMFVVKKIEEEKQ
ncbi:MAG: PaaI family thioesterase [Erysipelotrichaceae bacterium]|nr:PaaI family thioesterase [Erysipelotrichaceae bacterium]